ncbi:hypothetical protein LSAT2_005781 [Lamellibrachia satsuma]|nr:hypothetical protein LSAT2_005781 [Lamellibrachia satsuma]
MYVHNKKGFGQNFPKVCASALVLLITCCIGVVSKATMDRVVVSIIVLIVAILLRHAWQIYTTPGPDSILDVADGDPDDMTNFMHDEV